MIESLTIIVYLVLMLTNDQVFHNNVVLEMNFYKFKTNNHRVYWVHQNKIDYLKYFIKETLVKDLDKD
jgi:hypothetical protein